MSTISAQDKSAFQARRGGLPLEQQQPVAPKKNRFSFNKKLIQIDRLRNKKVGIALVIISVIVLGGVASYQYYLYQNTPAVIYAKRLHTLTEQVSKSVPLPKDEQPVTATVSDKSVLPHEAFFAKAQNGDKILMYKKNKLAVLYRPTTDQVITEATLDFRDLPQTPARSVAGASTSAVIIGVTPILPASQSAPQQYIPQGKVLIQPQQ